MYVYQVDYRNILRCDYRSVHIYIKQAVVLYMYVSRR
jgi:hypothetical protein